MCLCIILYLFCKQYIVCRSSGQSLLDHRPSKILEILKNNQKKGKDKDVQAVQK
jgi:hypothetical protein